MEPGWVELLMATNLILRNTMTSGVFAVDAVYYDMLVDSFGTTTDTGVVVTVASGTEIQWTKGQSGGTEIQWISGRVPAGGFTLTSLTAINIWCHEDSMSANIGARIRLFKRSAAGVETELAGGPFNDGTEFTLTTPTQMDWTANPTDEAFAEDDRLLLKVYITNVGTMGNGFLGTLTFNGASGATGDSLITLAETVAFKANAVPAPGTEVLLLHCDGTDGSTTITDSSSRVHTLVPTGDTQIDVIQSQFGGASLRMDGTGDELEVNDNLVDFVFGLEDFTIDFWVRLSASGTQKNLFDMNCNHLDFPYPVIYVTSANNVRYFANVDRITGSNIGTGQWSHIAVTRSSGTTRLFQEGIEQGSFADTLNYHGGIDNSGNGRPFIGSDGTGSLVHNGWIDEVHVVRGQALWTANFTPPTQAYPLPAVASLVFTPNAYLKPLLVR